MKSKSNSNQLATKEDIQKLASRNELKRVERALRQEIIKVEERLEGVEEGQGEISVKLDRIEKTLDGFVGTVDDLRKENTAGADLTRELEVKVDNHEQRITKLESPAA